MPIRTEYGSGSYGEGLYGGAPTSGRGSSRVGRDFDISLNGVGLKLLPQKKAYDKHAAQTFSYNPKSLFKQGDGAALVAKDLYYWSRLEHSRWDGGETYEPWAPDPNDPQRLNHRYSESFGFDVSDPHRLTHLREVTPAPSFEFVVKSDSPLAYWLLADHMSTTEMFDQISNDRTPGMYVGNAVRDILPGPIVNNANTISAFDGSTAYAATGPQGKKVPFVGGVTPTLWSLEGWINAASLPANELVALIGTEASAGTGAEYSVVALADNPYNYWKLNEVSGTNAVDSGSSLQDATMNGGVLTGLAGLVTAAIPNYGIPASANSGIVSGYVLPPATTAWSMECWWEYTGTVGDVFWHPFMGMLWSAGDSISLSWKGNSHNLGLHIGGVSDNDTGFTLVSGTGYHIVVTWSTGGPYFVYVNGALVATIASAVNPWLQNSGAVGVGLNNFPTASLLSKPAIYTTQLSLNQITGHYTSMLTAVIPGGFGFGIGDGSGGSGSKLVARLPGVGWKDSGYTFGGEGITVRGILPWWYLGINRIQGGANPLDVSIFRGGTSITNVQGKWFHVVVTYDATNLRFYVNGALVGTVAATPVSTTSWALIGADGVTTDAGANNTLSRFYNGLLCQIAVYSTVLTLAQIQAHYNAGTGVASSVALTANQTYAKFIETYNGTLFINQKNTKIIYSSDGGASWTPLTMPESDVTDFTALWGKGSKVYAATANNIYIGDTGGFVELNNTNPDITGATAGIFYSGQIYIGKGTSLYYVDPATGLFTQLYDTVDFTISFIEAFQGKIWFGGTNGRMTRLWTWTNNTLPPSPANGSGAQVQDGTLPYGFITRCSTVYLNTLLIGGTIAGDTASEGQGAVYYVTSSGQLGQLCVLGPLMKDIRGTGLDYGVRSMWGAQNMLWMGYSYNTGIARYDFGPGAFSSHVTTYSSKGSLGQIVNAVAFFNGKALFATKDGYIWKESDNKVTLATLEELEFHELPFLSKMIDGVEGRHSQLLDGQRVQVELSFDSAKTWRLAGENAVLGSDNFDFPQVAVGDSHWKSRVLSYRGGDTTQAPEIDNWSIRFAPQNTSKHEWTFEAYLPTLQKSSMGLVISDVGNKLLAQLWAARENGTAVDFVDRDGKRYKVLVLETHEGEITSRPARASGGQLQLGATLQIELLEVQKI